MFKLLNTLLLTLAIVNLSYSQNLVPNGDFEAYTSLPDGEAQWYLSNYWTNVHGSTANPYPFPSPDYFHTSGTLVGQLPSTNGAFANVNPLSGDGIMGLITFSLLDENWREYISSVFLDPMVAGVEYEVSFWLTNGSFNQKSHLSADHFGIHFSTNPLTQVVSNPIDVIPQIEMLDEIWNTRWKEYSFTYTPDSAYNYLTIGNFKPDSLTNYTDQIEGGFNSFAYYFIDKIEIAPTNPNIQIFGDAIICLGDSTTLIAALNPPHSWALASEPNIIISDTSVIVVSPSVTTNYLVYGDEDTLEFTLYVHQPILDLGDDFTFCTGDVVNIDAFRPNSEYLWQDGSNSPYLDVSAEGTIWLELSNDCGTVRDTLIATEEDCQCYLKMPDAFTPNGDNLNETFKPILDCEFSDYSFKIYSRWGELIFRSTDLNNGWDGKLQNRKQTVDVYHYSVSFLDRLGKPHNSSGTFSLVR